MDCPYGRFSNETLKIDLDVHPAPDGQWTLEPICGTELTLGGTELTLGDKEITVGVYR